MNRHHMCAVICKCVSCFWCRKKNFICRWIIWHFYSSHRAQFIFVSSFSHRLISTESNMGESQAKSTRKNAVQMRTLDLCWSKVFDDFENFAIFRFDFMANRKCSSPQPLLIKWKIFTFAFIYRDLCFFVDSFVRWFGNRFDSRGADKVLIEIASRFHIFTRCWRAHSDCFFLSPFIRSWSHFVCALVFIDHSTRFDCFRFLFCFSFLFLSFLACVVNWFCSITSLALINFAQIVLNLTEWRTTNERCLNSSWCSNQIVPHVVAHPTQWFLLSSVLILVAANEWKMSTF